LAKSSYGWSPFWLHHIKLGEEVVTRVRWCHSTSQTTWL
jgi:hypothetical protein